MQLPTTGLVHVSLRVTDLARSRQFYVDTLGFVPLQEFPGFLICNAYGLYIAFVGDAPQTATTDRFDPFRVGLDHLALGVPSTEVLTAICAELDLAGVPNHGVERDAQSGVEYISFYDPDGIAWELYPTGNAAEAA